MVVALRGELSQAGMQSGILDERVFALSCAIVGKAEAARFSTIGARRSGRVIHHLVRRNLHGRRRGRPLRPAFAALKTRGDVVPGPAMPPIPSLVLASSSPARAEMLRAAGVAFEVAPAAVDEAAVKAALRDEGAHAIDIAGALAELKARRIAGRRPGRLVLGADQVLALGDKLFDKPVDLADAAMQLRRLRGATHDLYAAAVIFEDGAPVWRHVGRAQMTMRPFSDAFLDRYLAAQGESLLSTVGAYRLEAGGAELFTRVQGDYFSVLGLPLLELLGFLRTRGICIE